MKNGVAPRFPWVSRARLWSNHGMLKLDQIRHVHFAGICGTGMASLAAMFKDSGLHGDRFG